VRLRRFALALGCVLATPAATSGAATSTRLPCSPGSSHEYLHLTTRPAHCSNLTRDSALAGVFELRDIKWHRFGGEVATASATLTPAKIYDPPTHVTLRASRRVYSESGEGRYYSKLTIRDRYGSVSYWVAPGGDVKYHVSSFRTQLLQHEHAYRRDVEHTAAQCYLGSPGRWRCNGQATISDTCVDQFTGYFDKLDDPIFNSEDEGC
jgi:hypothetical protein